jgi:hypothetical protein
MNAHRRRWHVSTIKATIDETGLLAGLEGLASREARCTTRSSGGSRARLTLATRDRRALDTYRALDVRFELLA